MTDFDFFETIQWALRGRGEVFLVWAWDKANNYILWTFEVQTKFEIGYSIEN